MQINTKYTLNGQIQDEAEINCDIKLIIISQTLIKI